MYQKRSNSRLYTPKRFNSPMLCTEEEAVEESIAYSNDEGGSRDLSVTVENNTINFFTEVHRESVLKLSKIINKLNIDLQMLSLSFKIPPPPIILSINSYGGTIYDCMVAVDTIQNSKIPVYTVIEGVAASAATIMSIVGKKRFIRKNARMLIHQLSSGLGWMTYEEILDEKENCDQLMKTLKQFYIDHTKIPENELSELLKHDLFWDSSKCLKMGLVDKII